MLHNQAGSDGDNPQTRIGSMGTRSSLIIRRIVSKKMPENPQERAKYAAHCIVKACRYRAQYAKVYQTPGGFITDLQPLKDIDTGPTSSPFDFKKVIKRANRVVDKLFKRSIRKLLSDKTNFITIGLDVRDSESDKHVELVGTFNTKRDKFIRWTGKSYPLSSQARTLLYCTDLTSHFQFFNRVPVLILGCHDLNIFSRRSHSHLAKGSYKSKLITAIQKACNAHKPKVVLHHPHYTDSSRIWATAWSGVREFIPTVHTYSSAIHYENIYGGGPRQPLDKVLAGTQRGNIQSVIVD